MAARNRGPRSTMAKEDLADEVQLWHSIIDKIRRCAAVQKQFEDVSAAIPVVENKLIDADPLTTLPHLEDLSRLHRDGLKLAEEELKILTEEPDDLLKNLELLISVRAAFETELPPSSQRSSAHPKSSTRNLKRRLEPELGGSGPTSGASGGSGPVAAATAAAAVASGAPSVVESPALTPETIGTPAAGGGGGSSGRLVSKLPSRSGSVAATAIKSEPSGEDSIKCKSRQRDTPQLH